ncbi:MAG: rod shape-determining protein [Christensenellaceae bacterium]|jgi:rod shape-determining protein MreB|nr:rod shape-determining protein [Christensenellaceae bacterium]
MFGNRLINLFYGSIAVDLGTVNTLVALCGQGIALREPTAVAVSTAENKDAVLSVGSEAMSMLGRAPSDVNICYPMRDGVISDLHMCEVMLKQFIARALGHKPGPLGVRLMLCLPLCATDIERHALAEAAKGAGAREVLLMEEPVAAALGAGISPGDALGSMVVDIGGGTTDAAVLVLGGIAAYRSVRTGGTHIDAAIVDYIRREHNMMIGTRSAEQLKCELGRAVVGGREYAEIYGRNVETGLPMSKVVTQSEISHAIIPPLRRISETVRETLGETPPELAGDLVHRGIVLTGGGARLYGIADMLAKDTGMPVRVAEDPLDCVVLGALRALQEKDGIYENTYADVTSAS